MLQVTAILCQDLASHSVISRTSTLALEPIDVLEKLTYLLAVSHFLNM
jgi:hypothetical protein